MGYLRQLAADVGVLSRCIFLGYQPNARDYLSFFDLFIIPSYSEGFPLGLLEAAQHHLPIVCSDIGIFKELFTQEEVSFFEVDNVQSLVKSILHAQQKQAELSENV